MKRFALALLLLPFTLIACIQAIPIKDGIPYGGTWLLTFNLQGAAQPYLFHVEISGQTVAGSYGSSLVCSAPNVCDEASERFAQLSKEEGRLRILIFDGKVIIFAGEDTDGVLSNGGLRGTATYLFGEDELSGTFNMLPK